MKKHLQKLLIIGQELFFSKCRTGYLDWGFVSIYKKLREWEKINYRRSGPSKLVHFIQKSGISLVGSIDCGVTWVWSQRNRRKLSNALWNYSWRWFFCWFSSRTGFLLSRFNVQDRTWQVPGILKITLIVTLPVR